MPIEILLQENIIQQNLYHILIDKLFKMMIQRSDSLMSDMEESEKLQLFISCRNLADLDVITVTDSFLVIKLIELGKAEKQVLKTKVYYNDLNPNYAQSLLIDFVFEIKQRLIFEVYHESNPPKLVGRTQTSLGEIFGSPQHGLVRDLGNINEKKQGKIVIRCQKQEKTVRKYLTFKIKAHSLPNMKTWWLFGGTCSFFRIVRKRDKDQLLVYESETVNYTTQPSFKQFRLSERKLTKNQQTRAIGIRFYNYSNIGNHQLLGSATFNLVQLQKVKQYRLMLNSNKQENGTVVFDDIKKSIQYSFTDYIKANLELALVTCIDFTASNGKPTSKDSLHYFNGSVKSVYEKALMEVTSILMDYDYDKLIPVYGFGARVQHPTLSSEGKVHHCFPINGTVQNPNLYGIDSITKEYRNILKFINLSGPTYFAQLLKQVIAQCREFQKKNNQYMILFIITDGEIHDRQQTIDLIIKCGRLPISIIIVGVGNSDFAIMHELDDDDCKMVDSNGQRTERDLVQFVQFKKFSNNGIELARQVLEQLPRQVSQYFQLKGLSPQDVISTHNHQQNDVAKILKQVTLNKKSSSTQPNPYY